MCFVVQTDATDDWDILLGKGTKELLDSDNLLGHLGCTGGVKQVRASNDFCLQSCAGRCVSKVKVWTRQDWLAVEGPAVGCDEADQSLPCSPHDLIT